MSSLYRYGLGGLFVGFFLALLSFSPSFAAAPSPTSALTPSAIAAPLKVSANINLDDLPCGSPDDPIDFGTTHGVIPTVSIHGDAIITDYVLCPLANLAYQGIGAMINLLEQSGLLEIRPMLCGGAVCDSTKDMFAAWGVLRDLANFGIIAGFLLVIFSQATSYGLSAYGVKKMLPKIVIAALLVNLSFVICAVLIDVFNILGATLNDMLVNAMAARTGAEASDILDQAVSQTASSITGVLAVPMALLMLTVLGLLLLFGLAAVFFLIARQILVVILIIGAPLACIAWLFPNTEKQFNKWMSTFIRLLAIYPIVTCLNFIVLIILIALGSLMGISTTTP